MTKVKPFIKCVDYWPGKIPPEKLATYNQLIREDQILKPHVLVNTRSGATTVEYLAIAPHEWILEELKRRSKQNV